MDIFSMLPLCLSLVGALCMIPQPVFCETLKAKENIRGVTMPDPDEYGNIPTLNKYGFMSDAVLDPFTRDFVIHTTRNNNKVIEIGAGFGSLSLELLKNGASVIVNDLDGRHLEIIKKRIPKGLLERAEFKQGEFPRDIDLPAGSLDAVFCRIFQFISGKDIEIGLEKIMKWLKPGGRLYVVVPTIYMDTVPQKVRDGFERKRRSGDHWPGMNISSSDIYKENIAYNMPKTLHLFDIDTLINALFKSSYEILRVGYFDRYNRFTGKTSSGKEGAGVIAIKPGATPSPRAD